MAVLLACRGAPLVRKPYDVKLFVIAPSRCLVGHVLLVVE
jgi:hypothetical protein